MDTVSERCLGALLVCKWDKMLAVMMGFVQVVLLVENVALVKVLKKVVARVAEKDLREEYMLVLKTVLRTVSKMVA